MVGVSWTAGDLTANLFGWNDNPRVAQLAEALVLETSQWGFESLDADHFVGEYARG